MQLTQAIKKSRGNDLPVKIAAGTTYQQRNVKAEITEYEFGKKYVSVFKSPKLDVKIAYYLEDNERVVRSFLKKMFLALMKRNILILVPGFTTGS
jgi:cobalamin biosynthesis Co2+ chelatase CbiK